VSSRSQIWFTTANGGFWVVRLEGRLRAHLGLDAMNRRHGLPALHVPPADPGRPGTLGVRFAALSAAETRSLAPYYCTVGFSSVRHLPVDVDGAAALHRPLDPFEQPQQPALTAEA